MLVYQSIARMRWPMITRGAGGGTLVASITAVLRRFNTAWAPQVPPEASIGACEEAGSPAWRDRVLTPVPTIQLLLLQILHGHTACRHLPPLSG